MFNPENVPSVKSNEELTRYVLRSKYIRSGEQTVKPAAFIPYPHKELSVNRLREATEEETWEFGNIVASITGKSLRGRADVNAKVVIDLNLIIEDDSIEEKPDEKPPIVGNPNHANIKNWPKEKYDQKEIAQEIARQAKFLKTPE